MEEYEKRIYKRSGGLLLCWYMMSTLAVPVQTIQNTQIDLGDSHYLAIKPDGSLWAWGNNFDGQIGNGESGKGAYQSTPVKVIASGVIAVSGGKDHTLALNVDGSVWAWGSNDFKQLGYRIRTGSATPKKIMDSVQSVSAGAYVSAAVKTDGSLWTWGFNMNGSGLGRGERKPSPPGKVMQNVVFVKTNGTRFFAVKRDNSLWAWGSNAYGELGTGRAAEQWHQPDQIHEPFQVMDGVKDIAVGRYHTLVLKKDDTLWTFGHNLSGQLGDGTGQDRLEPVKVLEQVKSIAAGGNHSLAVTQDGCLWAWGSSRKSQMKRCRASYTTPTIVMTDVAAVSSHHTHSLAVKWDNSIWAWRSSAVIGAADASRETGEPEQMRGF